MPARSRLLSLFMSARAARFGRLLMALPVIFTIAPNLGLAEQLRIAAASNAAPLVTQIGQDAGIDIALSTGSSGALAAQILHGAPFDMFLSADTDRPAQLAAAGKGTAQPYALGRLVLWSATPGQHLGPKTLRSAKRVAIANPELAPYGAAAQQVLIALDAHPQQVMGQNIGQTTSMVATGNVALGLVAASLVPDYGSRWDVPADLYDPIRQDMITLIPSPEAAAFIAQLHSAEGRATLQRLGFEPPYD